MDQCIGAHALLRFGKVDRDGTNLPNLSDLISAFTAKPTDFFNWYEELKGGAPRLCESIGNSYLE